MATDVIFGAFVPQGWKMELSGIDGAEAKWAKAVEVAQLAEELGYDSIWVYDHFHNVPRPAHEAVFECWTTIAAISQVTSRVRLGQMVGCNSYRQPALLAKITSTVDVISGGRLDWGIGAGWYENEYKGYGFEFPPPRERIGLLRECVEIVRSMWTAARDDLPGQALRAQRGQLRPEAAAAAPPADLDRRRGRAAHAAGRGPPRRLLATSAASPRSGAHKREVLKRHCADVGRDDDEIRKTWSPEVFVRATEAEVEAAGSRSVWGEPFGAWRPATWWARPSRSARRSRPTSTSAARASSRGAPTTRTPRRSTSSPEQVDAAASGSDRGATRVTRSSGR